MTEQPDNDPVARAKELLGPSSNDASIEELLDQLLTFRTSCHPDRFTDPDAKQEGAERFKLAQQLIADLNSLRQKQLVKRPKYDLATQPEDLDTLNLRLKLNAAEVEISKLKNSITELERKFASFQQEVAAERAARRESELAEIRKLYEPSKNRLLGAAIAVLLTGSLGILSQLEKVAAQLERIWPRAPETTRVTLFGISLIILAATVLRWLRHTEFQAMLSGVCTTDFARRFLRDRDSYGWHRSSTRFDEVQVVDFLEKEFTHVTGDRTTSSESLLKAARRFIARIWWWTRNPRAVYRRTLSLLGHGTYNHLKDAFIYWLIQRQLVAAPKAIRLAHEFVAKGDGD